MAIVGRDCRRARRVGEACRIALGGPCSPQGLDHDRTTRARVLTAFRRFAASTPLVRALPKAGAMKNGIVSLRWTRSFLLAGVAVVIAACAPDSSTPDGDNTGIQEDQIR